MMGSSYQIVLLGTPFWIEELINSFSEYPMIEIKEWKDVDSNLPVLYLYYGSTNKDAESPSGIKLEDLVSRQDILPIVKDPKLFREIIPKELSTINAFKLQGTKDIFKLKNRILTWFGLIDETKKIFISYKRTDSQEIAVALFHALVKRGYIPFLDDYSINSGVDFQEYLRNEIIDSDMFIMLNSENYELSDFTMEELKIASRVGVGILQVLFNGKSTSEEARFSYLMQIDTEKDKFNDILDNIIYQMEVFRAKGFKTKRRVLIDTFKNKFSQYDFITNEDGSTIIEELKSVYSPVTHVPRSEDLEYTHTSLESIGISPEMRKVIFYYGLYCRKNIKNHLRWLNQYNLPVISEDITQ